MGQKRKDKIEKMEELRVELLRDAKDKINPLELLRTESNIRIRERVTSRMLAAYIGTLIGVFSILYLQGFSLLDFKLDAFILHYLLVITIGQTAIIVIRLLGPIFGRK